MDIKLFDSELKVMCVLWNEGDTTAKHISDVLKKEIGWNMNTTYTLIKRCIKKGAIERSEPNFMCHGRSESETLLPAGRGCALGGGNHRRDDAGGKGRPAVFSADGLPG